MASKAYLENLDTITAIPSDVVPMTGYTDETPAVIDRTTDVGSENAIGCDRVQVFADISSGPSAATALDVYVEWSFNSTDYSAKEYAGTIPVAVSQTGYTVPTTVLLVAPYCKLYLQAPSAILTCTTYASPEQWEGQ
jgi:hypothetical protein